MKLTYTVDKPEMFSNECLDTFLMLLKEQAQINKPTMQRIKGCSLLCMAHYNNKVIGIGAIKHITKSSFTKAGVEKLAVKFDAELGYLYVKPDKEYRRLGIGKTISRLLLKELGNNNVFATTAVDSNANSMLFILTHWGFEQEGNTYIGGETKKTLGLFLKYKKT